MIQPDPVVDFHAFVTGIDGDRRPLDIVIHQPERLTDRHGFACRVHCTLINGMDERPFHGGTPEEALMRARIDTFHGLNIHAAPFGVTDISGLPVALPDLDIIQYERNGPIPESDPVWSFDGHTIGPDGSVESISVSLFSPLEDVNGTLWAPIACARLWENALLIDGTDDEHAFANALHFVSGLLTYRSIGYCDATGTEVCGPVEPFTPATERRDLIMKFDAVERHADGTEEPFQLAISEPKRSASDDLFYARYFSPLGLEAPLYMPGRDPIKAVDSVLKTVKSGTLDHNGSILVDTDGNGVPFPGNPLR